MEERFAGNSDDGSLIKCQFPRGAGPSSPRRICFACGRIHPCVRTYGRLTWDSPL